MTELNNAERTELRALSDLTYCNPFEPVRIELEQTVLGNQYQPESTVSWSRTAEMNRADRPNVVAITELASKRVAELHERQQVGGSLRGEDAVLYDDLVTYTLYYGHIARLANEQIADGSHAGMAWKAFRDDREHLHAPLAPAERARLTEHDHLFACLHQVRRAFNGIFTCLIGDSAPSTRLRAAVWQSIFTHDLRRYRRVLFRQMSELSTLVVGPSGSGKELVAQAIGHAQYWPFDSKTASFPAGEAAFTALNLSALSPTLIESELFGHRKGSFTGASGDHAGWLERCPAHGAVLLDEIGELDPTLQVKLLRVAQTRDYSRLGETKPRHYAGKLLAATNRDLAAEMRAGRFREDLYYRLCSDRLVVPSLAEQLADRPETLGGLVRFLASRVLGDADDQETESLANEVEAWIAERLPPAYAWPGNIRELEQCVRSVLVRREYHPAKSDEPERADWLQRAERCELTADELLDAYCQLAYRHNGGYEPAARAIGLDRRTIKARVTKEASSKA
ncbi:MAG: sigma-54 factor interaction domain-containing protein [Planctomycetota bacterium]